MFVEEKSKGEVPDFKLNTIKLSTAIRIGCTMAPEVEDKVHYYGPCGGTCALGAAHEATIGRHKKDLGICGSVADRLGIPQRIVSSAVGHFASHSREEVADWLEAQGY